MIPSWERCALVLVLRPQRALRDLRHPDLVRVNYLIAQGVTLLALSCQFKLPKDSLYRHAKRFATKGSRASPSPSIFAYGRDIRQIFDR